MVALATIVTTNLLKAKEIRRSDQKIDWIAANDAKQIDAMRDSSGIEQFRSAQIPKEVLEQTHLPVLVFGSGPVRAAPKIYTQGVSYASTYSIGSDTKLTVLGSRSAIELDEQSTFVGNLEAENNVPYTIDYFEDGIDLNFSRFGATYTLRLTCAKASDKRCTEKDFIEKAYESLITVGGAEK